MTSTASVVVVVVVVVVVFVDVVVVGDCVVVVVAISGVVVDSASAVELFFITFEDRGKGKERLKGDTKLRIRQKAMPTHGRGYNNGNKLRRASTGGIFPFSNWPEATRERVKMKMKQRMRAIF